MDQHNDQVAARGPDLDPQDYDNFGPLSEDELQALHERIVKNNTPSEIEMNDNTPTIATDEETFAELVTTGYPETTEAPVETVVDSVDLVVTPIVSEEDLKREAAQAEREAKYRAEREAYDKKDTAFGFEVAKLLNANLTKLRYGGVKVTGAWLNDSGNIIVTTAGSDTVTMHGYGEKYYAYSVDASILHHAKRLGHEPTDWAWSPSGKFSACDKCNAMARIKDNTEIIAAMYMAACPGKK